MFTDFFDTADNFKLRLFINSVDMVNTFLSVKIPLMHCVNTDVTRLPIRLRLASFANTGWLRSGLFKGLSVLAIGKGLPQVVEMGYGDTGQGLVGLIPIDVKSSFAQLLRGGAIECAMSLI